MKRRGKERGVRVRLLFADEGEFHRQDVELPGDGIERYDRLIDFLREEPAVLKRLHVDLDRLCSASLVSGEG